MSLCDGCNLSIVSIVHIVNDKDKLKDLLVTHGLILDSLDCPSCGHNMKINFDKKAFRCQRKTTVNKRTQACRFSRSIFRETFFEYATISVEKILLLISFFVIIPPPRQQLLENELKCSTSTVVNWSSYCRDVCLDYVQSQREKIGGVGVRVEIDKTTLYNAKSYTAKGQPGPTKRRWVLGGVQQNDKSKYFVVHIPDFTKDIVIEIIKERILPGTTIITDQSRIFEPLSGCGFQHLTVDTNKGFVDGVTGAHLQNVTRFWKDMRNNVPKSGINSEKIDSYLAEYLFKRSRPLETRVHDFLILISQSYPL